MLVLVLGSRLWAHFACQQAAQQRSQAACVRGVVAQRACRSRRRSSSASAGQAQELAAAAARPASWLAAAHGPGAAHERAGSPPAPHPAQEGQTQLAAAGWAKRLKPAQGAAPAATSTVAQ